MDFLRGFDRFGHQSNGFGHEGAKQSIPDLEHARVVGIEIARIAGASGSSPDPNQLTGG
jgi:hypothetical protein